MNTAIPSTCSINCQRRALGGCQQHAGEVAAAFFGQRCAQFGFHSVSPLPVCEGEVYGGKLRQRHARRAGERAEGHVLAADLGHVVYAGAAEFLAVARQQLAQHAALGQTNDKIVIAHGREVADAHDSAAIARRAQEGDGAALGVVHVQPCEAVPAVVDVPERAAAAVAGVERAPGLR